MAYTKKPQEKETISQRSNYFTEEFVIEVGKLTEFYKIVKLLNNMVGHGNWTTHGRPLRRLRRVDYYNRMSFANNRTLDIVFCLPKKYSHVSSRLMLEL